MILTRVKVVYVYDNNCHDSVVPCGEEPRTPMVRIMRCQSVPEFIGRRILQY